MWPEFNSKIKDPLFIRFVLGGFAGAASTSIIYPLFVIHKTETYSLNSFKNIIVKNGPMILYKGFASQLIHQTLFTSIRIGAYSSLHHSYKDYYKEQPTFSGRIVMGVLATTLSSIFGIPTDAIYKKLSNDKQKFITIISDIRKQGFLSLYQFRYGRKSAYNMVQLASYSQAKHKLQEEWKMEDDFPLYVFASTLSNIAKTCTFIPIKYIELHLQSRQSGSKNLIYFALLHNSINMNEYRNYIRQFSWSMLNTLMTFVILEKIANMYGQHVLGDNKGSGL